MNTWIQQRSTLWAMKCFDVDGRGAYQADTSSHTVSRTNSPADNNPLPEPEDKDKKTMN